MGWTWHRASHYYPNGNIDRKAECDAYFTERLNEGQYEILKSTGRRSILCCRKKIKTVLRRKC